MNKIEITAKINGKKVPLSHISTETFEDIKAAEAEENYPVATVCDFYNERRLILKLSDELQFTPAPSTRFVSIDLKDGRIEGWTDHPCGFVDTGDYRNRQTVR